jgi:hypothetical protein
MHVVVGDVRVPFRLKSIFRDLAQSKAEATALAIDNWKTKQRRKQGIEESAYTRYDLKRAKEKLEQVLQTQEDASKALLYSIPLSDLLKGADHKYLKKLLTGKTKPKWRYIYGVNSKHHGVDAKVGEKIRVSDGEQAGHYEIKKAHADGTVTAAHDETGKVEHFHQSQLHNMWVNEHADKIENKRSQLKSTFDAAMVHGSNKQKKMAWDRFNEFNDRVALKQVPVKEAPKPEAPKKKAGASVLYFKSKKAAFNELLNSLEAQGEDIGDYYRAKKVVGAPKDKRAPEGIYDAINEYLGEGAKVGDLYQGFVRLTRGSKKRWDDPDVQNALKIMRTMPGLSKIKEPDEATQHMAEKRVKAEEAKQMQDQMDKAVKPMLSPVEWHVFKAKLGLKKSDGPAVQVWDDELALNDDTMPVVQAREIFDGALQKIRSEIQGGRVSQFQTQAVIDLISAMNGVELAKSFITLPDLFDHWLNMVYSQD